MDIELKKIEQDEIVKAFFMQKKGFFPTYLKYFDKISPIFKSYSAFKKKLRMKILFGSLLFITALR